MTKHTGKPPYLQPDSGGNMKMKRVLIACETSGVTRRAFKNIGIDAWSCDILPADDGEELNHVIGDVSNILDWGWDLMIAHPPCTHLAVSGARHFEKKRASGVQQEALDFVQMLMDAPIEHIAIENPVSVISTKIRKPDQIIQPYMFGHMEQKKTCLWLKNLPKLVETDNVYEEMMKLPVRERQKVFYYSGPVKDRWKVRSKTYEGIADAFARQWATVL